MKRRSFLKHSATMAGVAAVGPSFANVEVPASITTLTQQRPPVAPITDDERRARVAKAQRLMTEQGIAATFIEAAPA